MMFEDEHFDSYSAEKAIWPPDTACIKELIPWLPPRQLEVAYFYTFVDPKFKDSTAESVHDLNISLQWRSGQEGMLPCVTCHSVLFLRQGRRLLHGLECLRASGMPEKVALDIAKSEAQERCKELSGNAFSGYIIAALAMTIIICKLQTLPEAEDSDGESGKYGSEDGESLGESPVMSADEASEPRLK